MKKSVMTLVGCALVAGVSMAASVTGNNTAVVIQKPAVQSNNYFQFICVPVNGFDITGSKGTVSISLTDVLPPSEFNPVTKSVTDDDGASVNTTLYPYVRIVKKLNADGEYATVDEFYTSNGNGWYSDSAPITIESGFEGKTPATVTLSGGDVLWLKTQKDVETDASGNVLSTTIFCGEEALSTDGVITPTEGMEATGNSRSNSATIASLCPTPSPGDQVFVTQQGSSAYQMYTRRTDGWYISLPGSGSKKLVATQEEVASERKYMLYPQIPSGEAFYYYSVGTSSAEQ